MQAKLRRAARLARRLARGAEAAATLTVAQVAVRVLPARRYTKLLGTSVPIGGTGPGERQTALAHPRSIGRTVERTAARLPWHPLCLPQAITTSLMLRRRGVGCTSHLGIVSRSPFMAHAWVTVGTIVVQGGPATAITELAAFATPGSRRRCNPAR